jgi:membrane associated rhomboid family serine protease
MYNRIQKKKKNILIINTLMFLAALLVDKFFMLKHFGLFCPTSSYFRPHQIITHMFLQVDFVHLFFNMYVFFLFGSVLEQVWGSKKFLLYYMITGLGAAALSMFVNWLFGIDNYVSLGASGAVFGVLLGYGMLFPNAVLQLLLPPIAIKAKWLVIIYGALELVFGILSNTIANNNSSEHIGHFAHIGGMLFGFILIKYWHRKGRMYF